MKKLAVIGAGYSGLSAAATLAASGYSVDLFDKHEASGGRARRLHTDNGFVYDMGPSWYWMPEVIEKFFQRFGYSSSDFYDLKLLDPSFTMIFSDSDKMDIPSGFDELCELFENTEKGSADRLKKFMNEAEEKYRLGIDSLVYSPGLSLTEFADLKLIGKMLQLSVFSSFRKHVRNYFKDPRLIALMEFPVLFLGARPEETPALYSLMNYAGLKLGTWYPLGGMGKINDAMEEIARQQGVVIHYNSDVESITAKGKNVAGLMVSGSTMPFNAVISSADYHHTESQLLPVEFRQYTDKWWNTRRLAPSCLIFYLGINKKIEKLNHHNLFFDKNMDRHFEQVYDQPSWPDEPLFYVCCPSKTDPGVAPEGFENLFILMPLAPGIEDTDEKREEYFSVILSRLEKYCADKIRSGIVYKKSYCINDFKNDYNAFKGNAYGLANTLGQTAIFKPNIKSSKLIALYFAGQLTSPGPGVPPSIISGQVAATQLLKDFKRTEHVAFVQ